MTERKLIEYHSMKVWMGNGEFGMYAPKPSNPDDIKAIRKFIRLWLKGLERTTAGIESKTT